MDKRNHQRNRKMAKEIKRYRRVRKLKKIRIGMLAIFSLIIGIIAIQKIWIRNTYWERTGDKVENAKPNIEEKLLTKNPYSRPGTDTKRIKGIVIHYTANPGATAMQNRNYFEDLKNTHERKASSNYIIGLDGEIVQCIPTWEVAYASNHRNEDTVSIETCPLDEAGTYTKKTYQSMVDLTAWLCLKFDLTEEDVIRHYDVTGKICPKYFVDHKDKWSQFKKDVAQKLEVID